MAISSDEADAPPLLPDVVGVFPAVFGTCSAVLGLDAASPDEAEVDGLPVEGVVACVTDEEYCGVVLFGVLSPAEV